jgi:hypothetical protein
VKLISYRIAVIPGNDYWAETYLVHSYLLGVINLGPEFTPDGEPIVFPRLSLAQDYIMDKQIKRYLPKKHS